MLVNLNYVMDFQAWEPFHMQIANDGKEITTYLEFLKEAVLYL